MTGEGGEPALHEDVCRSRADWERALATGAWRDRWLREQELGRRMSRWRALKLPGHCLVCAGPTVFRTRVRRDTPRRQGVWQPDWRNRQVCRGCRLMARHRRAAEFVEDAFAARPGGLDLYLTEQRSRLSRRCGARFGRQRVTGSEYLGPDLPPGAVRRGLRHEDLQALSFPDGSFDLVVTNDVLEHVPDPCRALAEIARVLRPDGELFLTIPFGGSLDEHRVRARVAAGRVVHLCEPEHHFDPAAPRRGVLVYTDFGWQILEDLAAAGLQDPRVVLYWSERHGHLGVPSAFLRAFRPAAEGTRTDRLAGPKDSARGRRGGC